MSLDKAITHHKEHRKIYGRKNGTYAKSIDHTCQNHGSCPWCKENRFFFDKKKRLAKDQSLHDYKTGKDDE